MSLNECTVYVITQSFFLSIYFLLHCCHSVVPDVLSQMLMCHVFGNDKSLRSSLNQSNFNSLHCINSYISMCLLCAHFICMAANLSALHVYTGINQIYSEDVVDASRGPFMLS